MNLRENKIFQETVLQADETHRRPEGNRSFNSCARRLELFSSALRSLSERGLARSETTTLESSGWQHPCVGLI